MRVNFVHWRRVVAAVLGAALATGVLLTSTETITDARPASPERAESAITVNPVLTVTPAYQTYLPMVSQNFPSVSVPLAPPMGLAFISSASYGGSETRYQRALAIHGKLNRWPMYWHEIEPHAETQPRVYNWTAADNNIIADLNHGLTVLPILMFTPAGLDTGGSRLAPVPQVGDGLRALLNEAGSQQPAAPSSVTSPPQGLYEPIFADNSDIPSPGKLINPDNRWAYFVNAAVNRYRPGGLLAQQQGWSDDRGVRYWEIWNEPDLDTFFTGTITDYARLLKVGYLAARAADPQAQIVIGRPGALAEAWLVQRPARFDPDRSRRGGKSLLHGQSGCAQLLLGVANLRLSVSRSGAAGRPRLARC